jgi:hypothetical protein
MTFWRALFRAMGTTRARRIGRREAEKLLSGAPVVSADRETLIRLLDLAAAAPRPEELVGQEDVVWAFVRARQQEAERVEARRRRLSMVTKALAVKILAGVAVLLLGGVALAAGTGNLPPPVQQGAHDLLSPLGVAVPDSPTKGSRHISPPASAANPGVSPSALPTPPGVEGLCEAWQTSLRAGVGKSMDAASMRALTAAAGGPEKIAAYCAVILSQPPASSTPPTPPKSSTRPKTTPPAPTPSHPGKKSDPRPSRQR